MINRVAIGLTSGLLSGVDVFSCTLATALCRRRFDAHVMLTESPAAGRWPLPLPDDVPVVRLSAPPHGRAEAVRHHLEGSAPCVYLPNYDTGVSSISMRLSRAVAVVGIVHSDDPFHYQHLLLLSRYWDAVVAVSRHTARVAADLVPAVAGRLYTIPYGVDVPPERPRGQGPLRLIYAGRLEQEQKRAADLVEIAAALRDRDIDATMTIAGDGPERALLERRIGEMALADRVSLLGTLPNSELRPLYDQHDVVLLCSAFEGLPVALLEAMARGCVPVVSDVVSGIPELIENRTNGFRVPIGDVAAFADAVEVLARDGARRRAMSHAARETIRASYTSGIMADRYADLFRSLLEHRHFVRPKPSLVETASVAVTTTARSLRAWGRRITLGGGVGL